MLQLENDNPVPLDMIFQGTDTRTQVTEISQGTDGRLVGRVTFRCPLKGRLRHSVLTCHRKPLPPLCFEHGAVTVLQWRQWFQVSGLEDKGGLVPFFLVAGSSPLPKTTHIFHTVCGSYQIHSLTFYFNTTFPKFCCISFTGTACSTCTFACTEARIVNCSYYSLQIYIESWCLRHVTGLTPQLSQAGTPPALPEKPPAHTCALVFTTSSSLRLFMWTLRSSSSTALSKSSWVVKGITN